MSELIEALTIFKKYGNATRPTGCEYKTLYVGIDPDIVRYDDIVRLKTLGFVPYHHCHMFYSIKYGSF